MELFKWMNDQAIEHIRQLIDKCWEQEVLPEDLEQADIVSIFKKGYSKKFENYRPN